MAENVAFVFGLVALGYMAGWAGILRTQVGEALTQFAIVVAVPALMFRTLSTMDLGQASPWPLWLCYFSAIPIVWAAGHLVTTRIFGRETATGIVGGVAASFSNLLLLGFPLMQGVFGQAGIDVLSLLLGVHLPVMMAASIVAFEWIRRGEGKASSIGKLVLDFLRNLLTNPIVVGIFAGLAWRWTGLTLTSVPARIIDAFAATAGTVALFAMGLSLRGYGLGGNVKPAIVLAALKLFMLPSLVLAFVWLVGLPPLTAKVAVVAASFPTGVNPYLIAMRFGVGQMLASNTMTLSTMGAVLTTGFWVIVAQAVFG